MSKSQNEAQHRLFDFITLLIRQTFWSPGSASHHNLNQKNHLPNLRSEPTNPSRQHTKNQLSNILKTKNQTFKSTQNIPSKVIDANRRGLVRQRGGGGEKMSDGVLGRSDDSAWLNSKHARNCPREAEESWGEGVLTETHKIKPRFVVCSRLKLKSWSQLTRS